MSRKSRRRRQEAQNRNLQLGQRRRGHGPLTTSRSTSSESDEFEENSAGQNADDSRGKVVTVGATARRFTFVGPIPPPEMLQAFEDVEPGLANRLVRMAERDQEHEHERSNQELALVGKQQAIVSRAQIAGSVISLAGLICGTLLILHGATTWGVVAVLGQAGATFMAVIRARRKGNSQNHGSPRPKEGRSEGKAISKR